MTGYVKLWRKALNNPYLQCGKAMAIFSIIMLKAEWQEETGGENNRGHKLNRGQTTITLTELQKRTGFTRKEVRTALQRLVSGGIINRRDGTRRGTNWGTDCTIITLCNYDRYQAEISHQGTRQGTRQGTGPDSAIYMNARVLNLEEYRRETNPPLSPLPGGNAKTHRRKRLMITPEWKPNQTNLAYLRECDLPATTIDEFRDHHVAKGSYLNDIDYAWRTWCNGAVKRKAHGDAPRKIAIERTLDELERLNPEEFGHGWWNDTEESADDDGGVREHTAGSACGEDRRVLYSDQQEGDVARGSGDSIGAIDGDDPLMANVEGLRRRLLEGRG